MKELILKFIDFSTKNETSCVCDVIDRMYSEKLISKEEYRMFIDFIDREENKEVYTEAIKNKNKEMFIKYLKSKI